MVRPREEGSRQSMGSSLAYLIESRRYKLVKPIPAEHPSWDRDRLRSQNNVGSCQPLNRRRVFEKSVLC